MQTKHNVEALDLYYPLGYKEMPKHKRSRFCNGCGTAGWKGYLVPDTMWGLGVREPCNIHDFMYSFGKTIEDKELADRVFLNNLTRVIEDKSSSRVLKYLRLRRARFYYKMVMYHGGAAFWEGKNLDY